jgi:hypothetical protein
MDCHLFAAFPIDVVRVILQYLTMKELGRFDSALLNADCRSVFLQSMNGLGIVDINQRSTKQQEIPWLLSRKISLTNLSLAAVSGFNFEMYLHHQRECEELILQNKNSLQSIAVHNGLSVRFFSVLNSCQNLTSISVEGCQVVNDEIIASLLEGKQIRSLSLSSCVGLSSHAVQLIAVMCPKIEHLTLKSLRFVTDAGVAAIIKGCPNLQTLDLSGTPITDVSIPLLLRAYPNIEAISVEDCHSLSSAGKLSLMTTVIRRQLYDRDPTMHLKGVQTIRLFLSVGLWARASPLTFLSQRLILQSTPSSPWALFRP